MGMSPLGWPANRNYYERDTEFEVLLNSLYEANAGACQLANSGISLGKSLQLLRNEKLLQLL